MVSWWPGDGNANDIQGSNNGTLSGGVTFARGEVDQAFTFNGTDGEVILPNSSSAPLLNFGPNDSFTIDAWLKPSTSVLGTTRVAVSLTYVCSPEALGLILLTDGSIDFGIRDSNNISVDVSSPASVVDGQWHHATGVRDVASHTVTLYLDGVSVASLPDTTTGTFTRADGQNRIGSIPVACPTNRYFWQGQIDEVEVFNRALSASEVQAIYNAGSVGKCRTCTPPRPDLQNWWTGDATVNDLENNNNGTWQGTESYAPGMVAQAFNFNGSSAVFINSSGNNLVMGTNDFTLDAWVNTTGTATTTRLIFGSGYKAVPSNISNVSLYIDSATNRANFFIRDAAGNSVLATSTRAINDGAWHHVAGSRQGTTALIYVDGVQEGSASDQSFGSVDTSCGTAFIGGYNATAECATNAIAAFFNGQIDEVELFKGRALSNSEIQAIVNAGSAGKCKGTPTPTPSPTCTPPPPNMVSWWPGDGNANDIQGGNNGTLQNGATFAAGMVGQAFSFDGIDDYVQATDTGLPFGSAARTLDLWMKPGSNGVEVPAIYGNFAANDAFYVVMLGNQTCIGRWGGGDVCGARNIRDGNWHHVALTYDGVSSVQLFIDGSLETSDTRTYSTTSRGKFYIGSTVEGSSQYYDGRVDEVEIFNRALSVSEIQAIYNAGSAGKCKPTATPTPTATATFTPTPTAAATFTPTATATATATATFTPTPAPTATATPTPVYAAQVQQPINADGTSVFTVRRGVVPVKFTLTQGGVATCALPPATIAVYRTGTAGNEQIDESIYTMPADSGSNFRIDSCQYVYNLNSSALGVGTYRVDILINNQIVGSAIFQLK